MSNNPDFVKNEDSEFSIQLNTFAAGVGSATAPNGATVGLSAGEITEAQNDAAYVQYVMQQQDKSKSFSQAYTKYKNDLRKGSATPVTEPVFGVPAAVPTAVPAGVEDRFRKKAAKAKNSSNYTKAIGEAWKILAPEASADLGVPEFIIDMSAGHPLIKWKKKSSDGVDIYKDSGKGFVFIGRDTKSPFLDKSDLPPQGQSAVWKYKLIYIKDDEPVGEYSKEATITVRGDVEGHPVISAP